MPPPKLFSPGLLVELKEKVELVTVNVPRLSMPPPKLVALLLEKVELVTVSVPEFKMPPPESPALP